MIIRQEGEEWAYYAVADEVVKACEIVREKFRTLREWAGLYTEFPEKLAEKVKEDLRKEYDQAQREFEAKLLEEKRIWEKNFLNEIKSKMKETLLDLSGM